MFDQDKVETELKNIQEHFSKEATSLRTGKVNASVIENVPVEAYGSTTNIQAVGQVQPEDAMNVKVVVWDKGVLPQVEQALRAANLGGSVMIDKDLIRIKFNPITEEDRKARVKELSQMLEDTRVKMRLVRQKHKKLLDNIEGAPEDDVKKSENDLQELLNTYIKNAELFAKQKESEIMSV